MKVRILSFVYALILLCSCVIRPHRSETNVGDSSNQTEQNLKSRASESLREEAMLFDRFMRDIASDDEVKALNDACTAEPEKTLFCYTVLHYEAFKIKKSNGAKNKLRKSVGALRPRFIKGKLTNWRELRYAAVPDLLKGMESISQNERNQLKQKALKENLCPNYVPIALAASLESQLSQGASATDIARLYEKGAECASSLPSEKEHILTRAGLFYLMEKNLKKAESLFTRSSTTLRADTARALYWLYRTRLLRGNTQGAKSAYSELKSRYPFSFHSIMAQTAEKEDPDAILSDSNFDVLKRSRLRDTANRLIEQVEILRSFGFEDGAARVLDFAIEESQEAEPEFKLYLVELKAEQGDYHSKIRLLSTVLFENPRFISRRTMELYFPKAFFPIFEKNASGIDPYLLLAIARQESAFNPNAVSGANARGLLQLLPGTAKRFTNRDLDEALSDPERNVAMGARYLNDLLRILNGQLPLALAAYNAGPVRVTDWLKRYPIADPLLFIDLIPYRETRNYVSSVLRNYYWYRRIHYPLEMKIPWSDGEMKYPPPPQPSPKDTVGRVSLSGNRKKHR